jgi:urease beta subunit
VLNVISSFLDDLLTLPAMRAIAEGDRLPAAACSAVRVQAQRRKAVEHFTMAGTMTQPSSLRVQPKQSHDMCINRQVVSLRS